MENIIEKSILVHAPLENVWDFIRKPAWWVGDGPGPDKVEVDGQRIVADTKFGKFPVIIEELKEPNYLACRWASSFAGIDPHGDNSTLVEFRITEKLEGTLVNVKESGFLNLSVSEENRHKFYAENLNGWEKMLEYLKKSIEEYKPLGK